jgi:hypothetical protein
MTAPFRLIIAGSRTFTDYPRLCRVADGLLRNITREIVIVSGGARGADALGEQYARARGYRLERYPADWERWGRAAGMMRNHQMVDESGAQALLACWDGRSPGTRDAIDYARARGLAVRILLTDS